MTVLTVDDNPAICFILQKLAFPLSSHSGGPPFAVSVAELVELFERHDVTLVTRETPPTSSARRRGLEELLVLQKAG